MAPALPHGERGERGKLAEAGEGCLPCLDASSEECFKCSEVFLLNISLLFSDSASVRNQAGEAPHSGPCLFHKYLNTQIL